MNIRGVRHGDASPGASMCEAAILGPVLVWSPCVNIRGVRQGDASPGRSLDVVGGHPGTRIGVESMCEHQER